MNYPKRYEKALLEALRQFRLEEPNGQVNADDIYKLLDANKQKRIRKQQIQTFLFRHKSNPEIIQSSQNSSTSDDNDSDSKRKYKKKNPSLSLSPDGKESELRERSARAIKRKQVFDPSDYSKAKKPEKPGKDPFCKICGKGFKAEFPDDPPPKKVSCSWCKKRRAHRVCIDETALPWCCDDCRLCSICDGDLPDNSPLISCKMCKEAVHQHCGNIDESCVEWICSPCKFSKDTDEPVKIKPKANRRNSALKKEGKLANSLNHQDEEIPDCSRWTPQQVYSYLIMYVPSEDAQAFLDQEIDGRSLKLMQRSDVLNNFNLKLGPALKVHAQVKRLQERSNDITLCWPN